MPTSSGEGRGKEGEEETKLVEHRGESVKVGKRGKRKKKDWSKHKGGAKSRGKQDTDMREKVNDKVERIVRATQPYGTLRTGDVEECDFEDTTLRTCDFEDMRL